MGMVPQGYRVNNFLNDTAFSSNILPNAGTTTSNYSNAGFDGVASSTENLTNNSTHNGFSIILR